MKLSFELTELEEKYIHVCAKQAQVEIRPDSYAEIDLLLEARHLYVQMFGAQYHEEKELLSKLRPLYSFMKNQKA